METLVPPAPKLIGSRYHLQEELGRGGMATVYRATDRLTGQTVALKQVNIETHKLVFDSMTGESDLNLALAREFQTLAALRHPRIISVQDYGFSPEGQPYFTMTLLQGAQPLHEAAQGVGVAARVNLLVQTLQALAYLHRHDIVHRDLKPANVLVQEQAEVFVLDFGLAIDPGEEQRRAGTLAYMAPEVLRGDKATPAADLYAVGVMAYQIFAGQLPFQPMDIQGIITTPADISQIDADYPLVEVIARLLAKDPAERYADAPAAIAAFSAAIDRPIPQEGAAIRESYLQAAPFVGREEEMRQLNAALQSAIAGRGAAWLVGGESGVGKSRLLDELRIRALVKGVPVLRGRAVEEGGRPFQLWREVLARLVLAVEISDLEAGILKEILPNISELIGRPVDEVPAVEGAAGQQRLALSILDVLKRYGQPLTLILEDLHWSSESLLPLHKLLDEVGELPLLLIGTYRDDEQPELPQSLPGMAVLHLQRLSAQAIARLSVSMLGEAGKRQPVLELLSKETEGNVLFLVEVVRALAEEAGSLDQVGLATLPPRVFTGGIQRLLQRRIARVPAWALPMLKVAAVAGRQIDQAILGRVADGGVEKMDEWLIAAANAAVLDYRDETWLFAHDKLRAAVMRLLEADEKAALHRQVAEAIEALYPDDSAQHDILLNHWHEAGDLAKELEYIDPVTERLVTVTAEYDRAEALSQRWLAISQPGTPPHVKALSRLAAISVQRGDFPAATQYAERTQAEAEKAGDAESRMLSLSSFGIINYHQGQMAEAHQYYTQLLELSREQGDREKVSKALTNLGSLIAMTGDFGAAQEHYHEALAINRELDKQHTVTVITLNLASLSQYAGDSDASRRYNEEALALAREIGFREGIAGALNGLGMLAIHAGAFDTAREYFAQCIEIFHDIGQPDGLARTTNSLGEVAFRQGEFAEAAAHFQQSLHLFGGIGSAYGVAYNSLSLAFARLALGQGEVAPLLHKGISMAQQMGLLPLLLWGVAGVGRFKLWQGEMERAAELTTLAREHPAFDSDMRIYVDWQVDELARVMEAERLAAAQARGRGLELEATVAGLLGELGG